MNIETELKETISKHLPSAVGDVLKKRLAEADEIEKRLKNATECSEGLERDNQRLKKQAADHDARVQLVMARETAAAAREFAVQRRENDCALAEFKVQAANEKSEAVKEVVLAVFANSKFKYREESTVPVTRTCTSAGSSYPEALGLHKTVETEG